MKNTPKNWKNVFFFESLFFQKRLVFFGFLIKSIFTVSRKILKKKQRFVSLRRKMIFLGTIFRQKALIITKNNWFSAIRKLEKFINV